METFKRHVTHYLSSYAGMNRETAQGWADWLVDTRGEYAPPGDTKEVIGEIRRALRYASEKIREG